MRGRTKAYGNRRVVDGLDLDVAAGEIVGLIGANGAGKTTTVAGMLWAGAAGFVLKGVPAEELHRAVRTVAAGGAWLDPAVTGRVLAVYREAPAPTAPTPALGQLTAREREVAWSRRPSPRC